MILERKERNLEIFADTMALCRTSPALRESIRNSSSRTVMIPEEEHLDLPENPGRDTRILVSGKRSFEAASAYRGRKTCVLNFASATNPGGGVEKGSSAQEESLCRCSTLFPVISGPEWRRAFYLPHRAACSPLYNDDILYSPDITVFKRDLSYPELMPEEEWFRTDVLTCAAPNLRRLDETDPYTGQAGAGDEELDRAFLAGLIGRRTARILEAAAAESCEVLILGAFGCGAFRNPPGIVAEGFRKAVEEYRGYFETVEFAVFHTGRERENYEAFRAVFG